MNETSKTILLAIVFGAIAGVVGALLASGLQNESQEELMRQFYMTENAVHVSTHSIRKAMDKGEASFILVDLRSAEEYEKEHIVGAISIPAYEDPDTSAYEDVDRIVGEFAK